MVDATDEHAQFEIERAVAETEEQHDRRRCLQYLFVGFGDIEHDLLGARDIAAIGDPDLDHKAGDLAGQRPVLDRSGDEGLVRHQHFEVVRIGDRDRADLDPRDRADRIADGDQVTDTDRAFEQDDDARDKVGDDFLQAETEPDAKRGDDPLQLGPVRADMAEGEQETDREDAVARDRDIGVSRAGIDVEAMQHNHLEEAGQIARGEEREPEQDHAEQHVTEGDRTDHLAGRGRGHARPEHDVVEDAEGRNQAAPRSPQQQDEQDGTGCSQQTARLLADRDDIDIGIVRQHRRTFTACVCGGVGQRFFPLFEPTRFGLPPGSLATRHHNPAHGDLESDDDGEQDPARGDHAGLQFTGTDRVAGHGDAGQDQGRRDQGPIPEMPGAPEQSAAIEAAGHGAAAGPEHAMGEYGQCQ